MKSNSLSKPHSKFCILCNKEFASSQNLRRHNNYAHKLCEPPTYVCSFCNTGFVNWEDYEHHHNQRLLKTFSRKKKKRTTAAAAEVPPVDDQADNPIIKVEEEFDPLYGDQQHGPMFYVDQQ